MIYKNDNDRRISNDSHTCYNTLDTDDTIRSYISGIISNISTIQNGIVILFPNALALESFLHWKDWN